MEGHGKYEQVPARGCYVHGVERGGIAKGLLLLYLCAHTRKVPTASFVGQARLTVKRRFSVRGDGGGISMAILSMYLLNAASAVSSKP